MTEWTDTKKAQWILENGSPDIKWVYERVNDVVFRRPFLGDPDSNVPPWIPSKREKYYTLKTSDERSLPPELFPNYK
jgi:hypothetical protein